MNSRKKLIAVGVVVIGALAYLLVSGFAGHSLHDAEVSEIVNNPAKFQGKGILGISHVSCRTEKTFRLVNPVFPYQSV